MKLFEELGKIGYLLISLVACFALGIYLGKKQANNHSLCAKAIEIKAEETDSLELELARVKDDLRQCEDLYRELNNQKN